jgi:hypothetical protein
LPKDGNRIDDAESEFYAAQYAAPLVVSDLAVLKLIDRQDTDLKTLLVGASEPVDEDRPR